MFCNGFHALDIRGLEDQSCYTAGAVLMHITSAIPHWASSCFTSTPLAVRPNKTVSTTPFHVPWMSMGVSRLRERT